MDNTGQFVVPSPLVVEDLSTRFAPPDDHNMINEMTQM
jgi:hypothetical protein